MIKAMAHGLYKPHHEENRMNKDQAKGRLKQVVGKVKEVTGEAVGNKTLEQKGKVEKSVGKAQSGYGDLKKDTQSD